MAGRRIPDRGAPEVWLRSWSLDLKCRPTRRRALLKPLGLTRLMGRRAVSRKNLGVK